MKQNKARTESDLKIGDRVRLVSGTLTWKGEIALQGKIGEVIERRDDGRVTIRFDGGRPLARPISFSSTSQEAACIAASWMTSRPGNEKPVTGRDLRAALDAVLNNEAVDANQRASLGCNIKWKAGNEPAYFSH